MEGPADTSAYIDRRIHLYLACASLPVRPPARPPAHSSVRPSTPSVNPSSLDGLEIQLIP